MKRHWLIQKYTDKPLEERFNEYVSVESIPFGPSQLEQVWSFCIFKCYDVKNITVLETASRHVYKPIIEMMLQNK